MSHFYRFVYRIQMSRFGNECMQCVYVTSQEESVSYISLLNLYTFPSLSNLFILLIFPLVVLKFVYLIDISLDYWTDLQTSINRSFWSYYRLFSPSLSVSNAIYIFKKNLVTVLCVISLSVKSIHIKSI